MDVCWRGLLVAAAVVLATTPRQTARGGDCCMGCDSCLKLTCFDSCCRGDNAGRCDCDSTGCTDGEAACGCCRCRKTLLHWPCQEINYASADDDDEPLSTDRPDFTETSTTVGLGRSQVEFGYTYIHDEEAGVELDAHSYPELLYRVGVLAEWFELRFGWNYAHERLRVGGAGDTVDGAEDLYVGCKLALFEQDGWLPEMAIVPQLTVPTGARAFTANEVMPGVNLLYGWDITEDLTFAGSTQVNRALDATGDFYEEYAQSFTVAFKLTDKIGVYNEIFGFFPHGAVDAPAEYYYNSGFTYLVNNDFQLDFRTGSGLNDRSDDFFAGIGGAARFGCRRRCR